MTTELEEPQTLTPVIIPVTELEKINATDAGLAQLKAKASELAAIGTPNKAAYDEVHGLVMVAVKVRTGALTIAKTLATPHKEKYDAIMSEGKRIGEKAKEAEDLLRPLKESYEAEQERIKKEEAEKAAAKIAARHASLSALKAVFDGSSYTVVGVTIDSIEVNALPDEEWNHLYASAELAYQNEQARLAEEQRVRDEEAARIAAEQQAERDRQAVIAREQEAERERLRLEQEEFCRKQREFQAEQKRVADEQAARQAELDRQQAEAERVRREAEQEAERIAKEIDDANIAALAKQQAEQEEAERKAQWDIDEAKRVADEAAALKAKNKADKERAKRLAPDKKALLKYLNSFSAGSAGSLTEPESADLLLRFFDRITSAVGESIKEVEAL